MRARHIILPALCLSLAALLLAPPPPTRAWSKIGGSLGETQRDVRVRNGFADSNANNNTTPSAQFPGYLGAELAIWKGIVEWGSGPHGNGTGDPTQGVLGNGGANFDAFWAGASSGIGSTDNNIVSAQTTCGGSGVLAYTETPISDGWRIRFCDEWNWDDGPGGVGGRYDIQSVQTHEFGHALGLGHSTDPSATMTPAVSAGDTSLRSISADDIGGVQCIYGVKSGTKPTITATVANAGMLTIFGTDFGGSGVQVWLTNGSATAPGVDPIVRVSGLSSSGGGTRLDLSIPAAAGPGDVIVNNSGTGDATVSNAFPTDLVGSFGSVSGPNIAGVTPASIDALIPGTDEAVVIDGTDLDQVTSLSLDGVAIDPSRWTIVDPSTITLDPPQLPSLGSVSLAVSDGTNTHTFGVTIVAPATPKLQMGTGDPLNVVDKDGGLEFILGGTVGAIHALRGSPDVPPILERFVTVVPSNPAAKLYNGGLYVIPEQGWLEVHVSMLPDPGALGMTWYALSVLLGSKPWTTSNLQSITLVQ